MKKLYQLALLAAAAVVGVCGCQPERNTLFRLLSPEQTGIHFANTITESDTINILSEEYVYNGGGVGIGDFNNDGLSDVYFTGNQVGNRLYLNRGGMQFEDVTDVARVGGEGRWCSGVALVDINQDGKLDVYVGATIRKDSAGRANMLYINQGPDAKGVPVFKESAAEYGIADTGNTTHSAFFDYDRDGDLDLYVLTNVINTKIPTTYRNKIADGSALNNDRLYRNNGNGTFTNVTKEAGILMEGFGLGITVSDINQDGWPDLYISNDYLSNDLLWINNGNGTFTNRLSEYVKHTCYSAMGNDVVDINNDGLSDIIALDMLPETNKRKKTMLNGNNYVTYINNDKYGYQYQYVRNVLQLNNGFTPKGNLTFSEIGQLAGVYQTDWSWTPLVADFDNDGYRDIIITNGFPRDVTDHDFSLYRAGPAGGVASHLFLVDSIPVVKISNYAFHHDGKDALTFTDCTRDWGIDIPSFSNGAAYADLDNDGDLDFVVNNINDKAFVYENQLNNSKQEEKKNHFVRLKLVGNAPNQQGIGTKVYVYYQGQQQYYEHSLYRGYLSTMENAAHFGVGPVVHLDSMRVIWPDGKTQLLRNTPVDQLITLEQRKATQTAPALSSPPYRLASRTLFNEAAAHCGIAYKHEEADIIDFYVQKTIPHKYSQDGPGLAVGDVDRNGLEDFYIGGSAGKKGVFFLQQPGGRFVQSTTNLVGQTDKPEEETGALFFDADNDGDLDLYAVSGSYEFPEKAPQLIDHLYLNNGKGQFTLDSLALPGLRTSGSCVKAADYDQDGDLDLFVGGRVVPANYPLPARSCVLRNDKGRFTDVTAQVCPALEKLGLVSDALWSDFDGDGRMDLVIAGEWMPLTFLKNAKGVFQNVTETTGIVGRVGWWNSLTAGDFDSDGDIDYVAGNLGLNTNYKASEAMPLRVYAKDFDGTGNIDPVLTTYYKAEDGRMLEFPMHTRDDLTAQIQRTRIRFPRYTHFGLSTADSILPERERKDALILKATHLASSYVENQGNGKFVMRDLPLQAQFAPVFGMLSEDFDGDGNLDLLAVGNDYGTEVFTGRYDAFTGLYLKGNGKGGFAPRRVAESGFFAEGDAKAMAQLTGANGERIILVTQNRDSLRVLSNGANQLKNHPYRVVQTEPLDAWVEITYINGRTRKKELYYGSSYLSQSSRNIFLESAVKSVRIYNFRGERRDIVPQALARQ